MKFWIINGRKLGNMLSDWEFIGALLAGVFIGAVTVEILDRKKPEFMESVRIITKERVDAGKKCIVNVKNAFVEGLNEKQPEIAS